VAFIPVIGQALAAVLMVVSAVTAIASAVLKTVAAAQGQTSWVNAGLSILMAALACTGLGALKGGFAVAKAAGGLKGLAGLGAKGILAGTGRNALNAARGVGSGVIRIGGAVVHAPGKVMISLLGVTTRAKSGVTSLTSELAALMRRVPSGSEDWAKLSGLLRDASRGKGNFGLGPVTRNEASIIGQAWVGPGARQAANGKVWVSADGLRQWRPPSFKPRLGRVQSNIEERWPNAHGDLGQWQRNGHLDITDP